jgi:hypothetical protein
MAGEILLPRLGVVLEDINQNVTKAHAHHLRAFGTFTHRSVHCKRSRARHPGVRLRIKFSSFVKLPGASRKSESDSGAGGKKSKVLLRAIKYSS